MKKVAIIGSPALHKNYQSALENISCTAVIFPDSSYIEEHSDSFDGLLLPGGGDVLSSLAEYMSLSDSLLSSSKIHNNRISFSSNHPSGTSHNKASSSGFSLDLEQLHALHLFHEMNKPVLGICKGMQLINLYFHGTIREVLNRNLHQNPNKDVYHPADNLPGSFLHALFGPHMMINSNHHQCIGTLGKDLQIIQHAPDKTAEAVSHLSAPIIGTQWHPERMPKFHHQDIALLFQCFVSLL